MLPIVYSAKLIFDSSVPFTAQSHNSKNHLKRESLLNTRGTFEECQRTHPAFKVHNVAKINHAYIVLPAREIWIKGEFFLYPPAIIDRGELNLNSNNLKNILQNSKSLREMSLRPEIV
jgi:hypothetical protein